MGAFTKGLNKIKKEYKKHVPEKVQNVINPVIKPVYKNITKPSAEILDAGIGKAKEIKNNVSQNNKNIKQTVKINKKNNSVNYKKGNYIDKNTQKKVNDTLYEEIEQVKDIVNLAINDPVELVNKIGEEQNKAIDLGIETIKTGYSKFKTNIALANKEAEEKKLKTLEFAKENPGESNPNDAYANTILRQQKYRNTDFNKEIEDTKESLFDLSGIFEVQKELTLKAIKGRDEILDDWSKNKTTIGKFGINLYSGFLEQVGNYPELIKNTGINVFSNYIGVQTGIPLLGKLIDWSLSAGDNISVYEDEVKLYENREATEKEKYMAGIQGVIFSEAINLVGSGIKKGAFQSVDIGKKIKEINPKEFAFDFWKNSNGLNASSEFAFEGSMFKPMVYLEHDLKIGMDGNLEQKRFFSKVKNQEITKSNYKVDQDPSFKLDYDDFRQESFKNSLGSNIENIDPNTSVFNKLIQSVPKDIEVTNKSGTPYAGINKIKQHFSQTRGNEVKQKMVKALEPTVKAIAEDRARANKNPVAKFVKDLVMGKEKAEQHFYTSVNQNLTYEKIGNSIVSKFNGNERRIEADFFNRLNQNYGGKIVDYRDWIREYKNDKNLFTKVYLETDFDNVTDVNLYKMIDGIRQDNQTIIKLDKSWNDSLDPAVIQRYPNLFTSEGVNEKEAFKHFLTNFKEIDKQDLKQVKATYDALEIKKKLDDILKRVDSNFDIKNITENTLKALKEQEKIRKLEGKEIFYDLNKDKFVKRKYSVEERKLFNINSETKTDNLFKVSDLVERYLYNSDKKYKNNNFILLNEDNFKMGRVESIFDKSKFFREYNRNLNNLGEFKNKEFFQENIFPKMLETFDISDDISVEGAARIYKNLYDTVRETTQASHLKGATTELGEILPMFRDYDSMVKFFSDMEYFFDNENFVENVVKKNFSRQSEYMTFGKPARSFVNDVNFNITKDIGLNNEIKLEGLYLESINGLKDKVNTAIENKIIKRNIRVTENNTPKQLINGTVDWANTTYLAWSGSGENLTNRAYSNLRAKEYMSTTGAKISTDLNTLGMFPVDFMRGTATGIDALANGFSQLEIAEDFARSFKKASSKIMGEGKINKLSDGDTSLLYGVFNSEFNKIRHWDNLAEIHNNIKDFTMTFQQTSEMHRNVIDVFNTNKAIFDTLNLEYKEVSPSMGKLFLINGIDEEGFKNIKTILKEYKKNGEIIQPQRLLDLDIEGYKEAGNLLALYDNLFYELNTLNKANAYIKGDFTGTLQGSGAKIFRSTTQGMSTDTFNKLLYFETQEGVLKNRFTSMEGLKNTAVKAPAIIPAIIALGYANKLGNLQKQMLTGRHDSMQYLSVSLAEESTRLNEVINSENPQELIKNLTKFNADTILEVLEDNYDNFSNSNLLDLVYQQIGKNIYRTLTNKGENDRGTAGINTLIGLGRLGVASIFGDKSLNFYNKGKRIYDEEKFRKENNQELPYDLTLIERIKDPDTQSRASTIYHAARDKMTEYKGLEKLRGGFDAFVMTGEFLKPESQSMFKEAYDSFFKNTKQVEGLISDSAEYIDSENKTAYQKTIEAHYKNLLGKLVNGEISQEEFERLFNETMESSNMVIDSNFQMMNKEYVNLFNDIADYRGMNEEERKSFKEEFMNIVNEVQGKNLKVDEERAFKTLDNFIPEDEQENFFEFIENREKQPKKEEQKEELRDKKRIVEVVGGGGGYTDVLYSDGTVWRRTGSRAARNNNPGNMDSAPWQKDFNSTGNDKTGEHKNNYNRDARNAVFATYEDGVKAYKHLVFERNTYKNSTIRSVMYNYAPPEENDTEWYIQQAMKGIPGEYRNIKMKDWPENLRNKLMDNMFKVEDSGGGFKEVQIGEIEK